MIISKIKSVKAGWGCDSSAETGRSLARQLRRERVTEENMSSPALQVCGQWHTPLPTHVHATHTCTQSLKREGIIFREWLQERHTLSS